MPGEPGTGNPGQTGLPANFRKRRRKFMAVSSVPGGVFQWSTVRLFRRIILLLLVLYLGAWTYRIVTRKYYVWLPGYVSWLFQQVTHQEKPVGAPVHVFFFFVDRSEEHTSELQSLRHL